MQKCPLHMSTAPTTKGLQVTMSKKYWFAVALLFVGAAYSDPPTPNSVAAATVTAQKNFLCKTITPFYWEIGDATGTLVSASQGVGSTGAPIVATTKMGIASSSKWLYGIYIVQVRGGAANLTEQDINFLHMTSGYTSMGGDEHPAGTCPSSDSPDRDFSGATVTTLTCSSGRPQVPAWAPRLKVGCCRGADEVLTSIGCWASRIQNNG